MNAKSLGINHLDIRHSLSQEWVTILLGDALSRDIILISAVIESATVPKFQLILTLNHDDTGILGIILVGYTVMKGFEYYLVVIFHALAWQETVVRENLERIIPDFVHHLRCCQQERYSKHLAHIVLSCQPPNDLTNMVDEMQRLRLAQKQYGRMCYLAIDGYLCIVQEYFVAP